MRASPGFAANDPRQLTDSIVRVSPSTLPFTVTFSATLSPILSGLATFKVLPSLVTKMAATPLLMQCLAQSALEASSCLHLLQVNMPVRSSAKALQENSASRRPDRHVHLQQVN